MSIVSLLTEFATIAVTIFIVELTDKDALLLLALATKIKAWTAFAAGATAFTVTSAIIVTVGYFLIRAVPIFWVRLAGGVVMIGFAVWEFLESASEEASEEKRLLERTRKGRSNWSVFVGAVSMLIILDLAGDATEVLTIVYVARFSSVLLVFLGAVTALVSASALETILGTKLSKLLSPRRIAILSLIVFLAIGSVIIVTSFV